MTGPVAALMGALTGLLPAGLVVRLAVVAPGLSYQQAPIQVRPRWPDWRW